MKERRKAHSDRKKGTKMFLLLNVQWSFTTYECENYLCRFLKFNYDNIKLTMEQLSRLFEVVELLV